MWDSAEILLQLTYSSLRYLRLLLYWITMILTYDTVMVKYTRLGSQTVQVKVWRCFSGTCIKQTDNRTLFWDMLWWLNEMIHVNDRYKYEVYSTEWLIQTLTLFVKTHFVSTFSKRCCPLTVIKSRVEKLLNPKWRTHPYSTEQPSCSLLLWNWGRVWRKVAILVSGQVIKWM